MNKNLRTAMTLAGLACVLSFPVVAATNTTTTTDDSKMSGTHSPSGSKASDAEESPRPSGTNGVNKKGTALPGSGGEAGSGGNSAPSDTSSGEGPQSSGGSKSSSGSGS